MGREFSQGRAEYKQRIMDHFLEAIPKLARKFPDTTIIIRPHPVENKSVYDQLASRFDNLKVVQEGNVIPWIRAAAAVIHNGCTTGIEAYLSDKPALAYVPVEDVRYGYDALIPNELSFQCQDIAQLEQATLNLLNHGKVKNSILLFLIHLMHIENQWKCMMEQFHPHLIKSKMR